MKKIAVAVLLLTLCAAPAFAVWPFSKKNHVPKDPRFAEHPKAYHPKNEQMQHAPKHKAQKHHVNHS
jgi:hypothetical protein